MGETFAGFHEAVDDKSKRLKYNPFPQLEETDIDIIMEKTVTSPPNLITLESDKARKTHILPGGTAKELAMNTPARLRARFSELQKRQAGRNVMAVTNLSSVVIDASNTAVLQGTLHKGS